MKRNGIIIICLMFITLFSCREDDAINRNNVGYLHLGLEINTSTVVSRDGASYNAKQLAVQIVDAGGDVVEETTNFNTNWSDKTIELPVGTYTVKASSAGFDGTASGFDRPYYAGSTEVVIESGKTANATLTCRLANVKVTVNFDETFKTAFTAAQVDVDDNQTPNNTGINPLTFVMGQTTQSGYFPVTNLKAVVSATNKNGVTNSQTNEITGVKACDHYILNYKVAETTGGNVTVTVDETATIYTFNIALSLKAETEPTLSVTSTNAWTKMVYLEGTVADNGVDMSQGTVTLQYRLKNAATWTTVATTLDGGVYKATVTDLTPATTYESRLVYGDETFVSEVKEFTTETAVALYNGSFDSWYQDGKVWYATAESDATLSDNNEGYLFSFWDSGNVGAATMSATPTSQETKEVHTSGGSSAKLASQFVGFAILKVGKFAAGNIYTGHYYETITKNPMGAKIFFGQPFTSRPTQLKGWYKYNRGTTVDYPSDTDARKTELQNSGGDQCAIYIALTDNAGLDGGGQNYAFEIDNTLSADDPDNFKYKNTIDFSTSNPNIIAYGSITEEEAKGTGNWQEFTIDLEYRDLTRKPKYIIVVASASKYGDYFTGSTGSVMYIDDFELIYGDEPAIAE